MENIDIQQIESYLRGKMTLEERAQFEAALAADPELRRRTDELRQFANDLRQVARVDIRRRVEAERDQIKKEEAGQEQPAKDPPPAKANPTIILATGLLIGILLGLTLGWLFFQKEATDSDDTKPVAQTEFDEIYQNQIPGPQPGNTILFTVLYNPELDSTAPPVRQYKFYGLDGGLCIYTRRDDIYWEKKALEISQSGSQFFLRIGDEKFPITGDGVERPLLPE